MAKSGKIFLNLNSRKSTIIFHVLFWVIVWIAITINASEQNFLGYNFFVEFVNLLFYIFIVYFNINYLFPKYLKGKSIQVYISYLILTALLLTPIKGAFLYILHYDSPISQRQILRKLHSTFLFSFMIAGATTIFKILLEWIKYQREKKKLEKEKMQSELKFLRSQINPHFLFNTLNNVYSLALVKSDKTPEIILKLSEILRYMLYECNIPKVKLNNEIKYIENYLALEKLRQREDVKIDLVIEGNTDNIEIAPLLFTPFLENAFKHGINKVISNASVNIFLKVNENEVYFMVENSKPEFTTEDFKKKQGGIGLANVKKRLKILYPKNYKLDIENTKKTYKIELFLNLNKKQ